MIKFQAGLRAEDDGLVAVVTPVGRSFCRVFLRIGTRHGGDRRDAEFDLFDLERDDPVAVGETVECVVSDGMEERLLALRGAEAGSFDFVDVALAETDVREAHAEAIRGDDDFADGATGTV